MVILYSKDNVIYLKLSIFGNHDIFSHFKGKLNCGSYFQQKNIHYLETLRRYIF